MSAPPGPEPLLLCRACRPLLTAQRITADPASWSQPGREQRGSAVPKTPITLSSRGEVEGGRLQEKKKKEEGVCRVKGVLPYWSNAAVDSHRMRGKLFQEEAGVLAVVAAGTDGVGW